MGLSAFGGVFGERGITLYGHALVRNRGLVQKLSGCMHYTRGVRGVDE